MYISKLGLKGNDALLLDDEGDDTLMIQVDSVIGG